MMKSIILAAVCGAAGFAAASLAASGGATAPAPALVPASDVTAPPAYLVVLGTVHDRDAFMAGYAAKLPPVYAQYGGTYLAVGRNREVLEGEGDFQSFIISKWPSMDAARAFWNSPEYAPLREARGENRWGDFNVYLLEGLPEAPPAD